MFSPKGYLYGRKFTNDSCKGIAKYDKKITDLEKIDAQCTALSENKDSFKAIKKDIDLNKILDKSQFDNLASAVCAFNKRPLERDKNKQVYYIKIKEILGYKGKNGQGIGGWMRRQVVRDYFKETNKNKMKEDTDVSDKKQKVFTKSLEKQYSCGYIFEIDDNTVDQNVMLRTTDYTYYTGRRKATQQLGEALLPVPSAYTLGNNIYLYDYGDISAIDAQKMKIKLLRDCGDKESPLKKDSYLPDDIEKQAYYFGRRGRCTDTLKAEGQDYKFDTTETKYQTYDFETILCGQERAESLRKIRRDSKIRQINNGLGQNMPDEDIYTYFNKTISLLEKNDKNDFKATNPENTEIQLQLEDNVRKTLFGNTSTYIQLAYVEKLGKQEEEIGKQKEEIINLKNQLGEASKKNENNTKEIENVQQQLKQAENDRDLAIKQGEKKADEAKQRAKQIEQDAKNIEQEAKANIANIIAETGQQIQEAKKQAEEQTNKAELAEYKANRQIEQKEEEFLKREKKIKEDFEEYKESKMAEAENRAKQRWLAQNGNALNSLTNQLSTESIKNRQLNMRIKSQATNISQWKQACRDQQKKIKQLENDKNQLLQQIQSANKQSKNNKITKPIQPVVPATSFSSSGDNYTLPPSQENYDPLIIQIQNDNQDGEKTNTTNNKNETTKKKSWLVSAIGALIGVPLTIVGGLGAGDVIKLDTGLSIGILAVGAGAAIICIAYDLLKTEKPENPDKQATNGNSTPNAVPNQTQNNTPNTTPTKPVNNEGNISHNLNTSNDQLLEVPTF